MTLTPEQSEQILSMAHDRAREGNTAELRDLVTHGVAVDAQDAAGNTLLMLAAYHAHADTVAMLIEQGADVNIRNQRDQAPVAGALFKGADEVVRALVAAGADLDAGTPTGRDAAEMFGRTALLEPQN